MYHMYYTYVYLCRSYLDAILYEERESAIHMYTVCIMYSLIMDQSCYDPYGDTVNQITMLEYGSKYTVYTRPISNIMSVWHWQYVGYGSSTPYTWRPCRISIGSPIIMFLYTCLDSPSGVHIELPLYSHVPMLQWVFLHALVPIWNSVYKCWVYL